MSSKDALECLENLEKEKDFDVVSQNYDYHYLLSEEALETIKQALLKVERQDAVLKVLENGIYYYDKYGKVVHLTFLDINRDAVKAKRGTRQIYFRWKDLNKKFFLNEIDATTKATEYLNKLKELNITLSLIKKVNNYIRKFDRYSDSSILFEKEIRDNKTYIYDTTPDYCFFDKDKLALICEYEYDDDYGGGYTEVEYPLKDFKRTWAFKESDFND